MPVQAVRDGVNRPLTGGDEEDILFDTFAGNGDPVGIFEIWAEGADFELSVYAESDTPISVKQIIAGHPRVQIGKFRNGVGVIRKLVGKATSTSCLASWSVVIA